MKYTDLKPRAYYARGPDQHFASRYIQQIFNRLVDLFPVTHRRHRFLTDSIHATRNQSIFIYDYTSFTSTFHESNNFIRALGRFFKGTLITCLDSVAGLIEIDLGTYLEDYVEACNNWCSVDAGKCTVDRQYSEGQIIYHNTGMLGVPGNISSCTLAHGLHLSIIVQSIAICRCIGDDAIGRQLDDTDFVTDTFPLLENIGRVALEKCEEFDDNHDAMLLDPAGADVWNYEKRSILRVSGRVVRKSMLMFPPIADLLGWESAYHVTIPMSHTERFRKIRKSLISLFVSAEPPNYYLSDPDEGVLRSFSRLVLRVFADQNNRRRNRDKRSGTEEDYLAQMVVQALKMFDCAPTGPAFFEHWWDCRPDTMELPVPLHSDSLSDTSPRLFRGVNYSCKRTRILGFLHKMEWADLSEEHVVVWLDEAVKGRVRDYFYGLGSYQHNVLFKSTCPQNMLDCVSLVLGLGTASGLVPPGYLSSGGSSSDSDSDDMPIQPIPDLIKRRLKTLYLVEKMRTVHK
jgi:hypothetical protein